MDVLLNHFLQLLACASDVYLFPRFSVEPLIGLWDAVLVVVVVVAVDL